MWTATLFLSLGISIGDAHDTFDRACTVKNGCVVDSTIEDNFTPVSQSPVWSRWSTEKTKTVSTSRPDLLASNAFLANAYAKTLWNVFLDLRPSLEDVTHRDEFLYLLDIDAGSGKFSHLVLQALMDIRDRLPFRLESKLKYVLTSPSAAQVRAWQAQPELQAYLAEGLVDFAVWDPAHENELRLVESQRPLSASRPSVYPLLVIANEVLQAQAVDVFQVRADAEFTLVEEHVGSSSDFEPVFTRTSDLVHGVYPTSSWNTLLRGYQQHFQRNSRSSRFPFPTTTLTMLENLKALAKGHVIVLAADRGRHTLAQWQVDSSQDPVDDDIMIQEEHALTAMVNFHLLGLYCALDGGYALHTPQRDAMLTVSALVLHPSLSGWVDETGSESALSSHHTRVSRATYPFFHFAFEENFVRFTPHDFHVLVDVVMDDPIDEDGAALLSLLKLSRWDPDVVHRALPQIKSGFSSLTIEAKLDIILGLQKTERKAFTIGEVDTHFDIGVVNYLHRDYRHALELYAISIAKFKPKKSTWFNIGICHAELKQHQAALEAFDQALAIDGNYAAAKTERNKALEKLKHDNDEL